MIRFMSNYNCIERTRSVHRHVCCRFLQIYWIWYVCMKLHVLRGFMVRCDNG